MFHSSGGEVHACASLRTEDPMIVFVGHKSGRKKMKQSGSNLSMFVIKQQSFVSSILYI
jgi:hypothetical protein